MAAALQVDASKRQRPSRWGPKLEKPVQPTPGSVAHLHSVKKLSGDEEKVMPKPAVETNERKESEKPSRKRKIEAIASPPASPPAAKKPKRFAIPDADHKISTMSNKDRPFIPWIAKGEKIAEGRVNIPLFQKIKEGETVCFHNRFQYVLCKVVFLHQYKSFQAMLEAEGVKKMLPFANSMEEGIKAYQSFPGSERVKQYGALAIGVQPLRYRFSHDEDEQICKT